MFGLLLTHLEVPTMVQPGKKQQQSSAKVVSTLGVPQARLQALGGRPGVETLSQQSLQACKLVVIVVLLVVTTPEVEVSDKDYWQTWAQGLEYPRSMKQ